MSLKTDPDLVRRFFTALGRIHCQLGQEQCPLDSSLTIEALMRIFWGSVGRPIAPSQQPRFEPRALAIDESKRLSEALGYAHSVFNKPHLGEQFEKVVVDLERIVDASFGWLWPIEQPEFYHLIPQGFTVELGVQPTRGLVVQDLRFDFRSLIADGNDALSLDALVQLYVDNDVVFGLIDSPAFLSQQEDLPEPQGEKWTLPLVGTLLGYKSGGGRAIPTIVCHSNGKVEMEYALPSTYWGTSRYPLLLPCRPAV